MKEKYQEQGKLYKEKRGILLDKRREMKDRLAQIREEMKKAALQPAGVQVVAGFEKTINVEFDQELVVSSEDEDMKVEAESTKKRKNPPKDGMAQASPSKLPKMSKTG